MKKTIFLLAFSLYFGFLGAQSTYFKEYPGLSISDFALQDSGALLVGTSTIGNTTNRNGRLIRLDNVGEISWMKKYDIFQDITEICATEQGVFISGFGFAPGSQLPRAPIISFLNTQGDVIWSKQFLASGNVFRVRALIPVSDGVLFLGSHNPKSQGGLVSPFMVRIDTAGNVVWSKRYHTTFPTYSSEYESAVLENDTLFVAGHLQSNAFFGRFNIETGELLGWKTFGGPYHERIRELKPTPDGNFLLSGFTRSTTGSEEERPWIVKVNRLGEILWSKTYNIPGSNLTAYFEFLPDGNLLAYFSHSAGFFLGYDTYAKLDANGNIIWAKNYPQSGRNHSRIQKTADGNFFASAGLIVRKINAEAEIEGGCCVVAQSLFATDFPPPVISNNLLTEDWFIPIPTQIGATTMPTVVSKPSCAAPIASIIRELQVCQGDSIEINGVYYEAPATVRDTLENTQGGCDTLLTYNLTTIPQPFVTKTVWICEGNTFTINGIEYVAPDVIFDILPSATACDTLSVVFLNLRPFLPIQWDTTFFCPGDTVIFLGNAYYSHNSSVIIDTIYGLNNACDTVHRQLFSYPVTHSVITPVCPPNIEVHTSPGVSIPVFYDNPSATTTCGCDSIQYLLQQGFASGELFPEGNTLVCYRATDVCNIWDGCCFEVNVIADEVPCDVKETPCIRYEILEISTNSDQQKTYRMRVTNNCASPLNYTAFQIPQGITAEAPAQNSTYTSPNSGQYTVRNPNSAPFRSIRFKTQGNGIANGQSDIFEYTLPAQAAPTFIQAFSRLESGAGFGATLNVFDCPVVQQNRAILRMEETAESPTFELYPNPNSGEVFLHWPAATQHDWQYEIFNAQAQKMQTGQMAALNKKASLQMAENLSDGVYFLILSDGAGDRQVARFVLKRGR